MFNYISKIGQFVVFFMARKMLGIVDDFRTFDWVKSIQYPKLIYDNSNQLLNEARQKVKHNVV